jgi:AcrR family transcriptional regulator
VSLSPAATGATFPAAASGAVRRAEDSRRRLTARQVALFGRLLDAAAQEARRHGYDATTVRGAARRAGLSPATAYTLVASKDHLLAEVLWRRMEALGAADHDRAATPLERVEAELRLLGSFMADDPVLAAACTTALLGSGPEVRAVRVRFGSEVHARLRAALGEAADPTVVQGLELAYSGAMLWAGMGHLPFAAVPDILASLAARLMGKVP